MTAKTKPQLMIDRTTQRTLSEHFEGASLSLQAHFDLASWPSKGKTKDTAAALAKAVASALDGVVHSSDVDCEYFPVVLRGAAPTAKAFYAALGVDHDARTNVAGYDNPTLDVISTERGAHAFQPFTRLGDSEIACVDEYIEAGDQKALAKAVGLLGGAVVGVQLCATDHCSKSVFALGKVADDTYAGVLTVRVET